MQEVEPKVFEGEIAVPYRWTTGRVVGRFLTEMRDSARLMGTRCGRCDRTYMPPTSTCPACYGKLSSWVELPAEGSLVSWTVVHHPIIWRPAEPPYALGLIRLDGADTELLHMVRPADDTRLHAGARMRAVWREERRGVILDVEYFELVEE